MKLKNKLLPLVGLSTAIAATAPIALASCHKKTYDTCDIIKYDETKAAVSTRTTAFKTDVEASTYYRDELIKNSSILKDDLKCYHKALLKQEQARYDTINKWEVTISNDIGIGSVEYWAAGTKYFWPTLTFTCSSETDVKWKVGQEGSIVHNQRLQIKWECSYKNFPFTVSNEEVGGSAEEWNVSAIIADENNFSHLMYIPGWSYSFTTETIQTDEYNDTEAKTTQSFTTELTRAAYLTNYSQFITMYDEYTKQYPEAPTPADFIAWLGIVDYYSNYMHNIPHA